MFRSIFNKVTDAASNFADDPVGTTADIATQPIRDGIDIIDGLSAGELREKAVLRLGADIAGAMALSELIDWYSEL